VVRQAAIRLSAIPPCDAPVPRQLGVNHIDCSQDARSYPLLLLWSLLAWRDFVSFDGEPAWRRSSCDPSPLLLPGGGAADSSLPWFSLRWGTGRSSLTPGPFCRARIWSGTTRWRSRRTPGRGVRPLDFRVCVGVVSAGFSWARGWIGSSAESADGCEARPLEDAGGWRRLGRSAASGA